MFLISALDGGEWSASRPSHFTPGRSPRYSLDRRLSGPQSRFSCGGEEKNIPVPARNRTTLVEPVASSICWLSYSGSYLQL